ncbi:MerR family transcriptional regulator [uncultured Thiocystis sp.]|jgi:DNA-binding transcriptional MerR regulator|uniref:MerR family transcriptional regulator n=1 Tax=uncultured Thiocystis sp. TaxID=1202134 RepID=UPI0025F3FC14|nr:MerR family transcriptional regulator [uncultured Thiocystis sp.]
MNTELDINTLSQQTQVSVRTIRYYLAEGLLSSVGRGPTASYGAGHRDRLLLIRRLQDAHQPLAAIRTYLEALDDAGVAAALAEPSPSRLVPTATSAQDYVRQVLAKTAPPSCPPAPVMAPTQNTADAPRIPLPARSTWERIALHPDLELHVRRPLARADQRRLDELLEQARRLFGPTA